MSHRHPLITFLSFLVNARCILLIQTAVFITGNGLRARKRRTEEGSRGRERSWRERRAFFDEERDGGTFLSTCSLRGRGCGRVVPGDNKTVTHTHCGCVPRPGSSIIRITIKFPPPSGEEAAELCLEKTSHLGLHLGYTLW